MQFELVAIRVARKFHQQFFHAAHLKPQAEMNDARTSSAGRFTVYGVSHNRIIDTRAGFRSRIQVRQG